ncbi:hypothetical protein HDU97_006180 [Phlyctochytrium planicorne]|nr:hypothetical protein HDU97_006180 [Phlyctochytrium planicorne]
MGGLGVSAAGNLRGFAYMASLYQSAVLQSELLSLPLRFHLLNYAAPPAIPPTRIIEAAPVAVAVGPATPGVRAMHAAPLDPAWAPHWVPLLMTFVSSLSPSLPVAALLEQIHASPKPQQVLAGLFYASKRREILALEEVVSTPHHMIILDSCIHSHAKDFWLALPLKSLDQVMGPCVMPIRASTFHIDT